MPLSVTAPSEPAVVESVTAPPLVARSLPPASFNCRVTVDVLAPSATIEPGLAVMVDVAVEAPPPTKETAVLFARAEPLSAPVIVAVPTLVEETRVAV